MQSYAVLIVAALLGVGLLIVKPSVDVGMWVFRVLAAAGVVWVGVGIVGAEKIRRELEYAERELQKGTKGIKALAESKEEGIASGLVSNVAGRVWLTPQAFTLTLDHALDEVGSLRRVALEQVPALFTALGILFTFYGLVEGLHGFNLQQDSTGVMRDLGGLLEGVGVAFESSLWGIFLSVTSLLFTRQALARLGRHVDGIRTVAEWNEARQDESPGQLLAKMSKSLSEIKQATDDQSAKMGTLATDLAVAIGDRIGEPLQQMSQGFDRMANAQAATHAEALQAVMNEFQGQFSELLGDQLKELGTRLEETLDWHRRTQTSLERTLQQLEANSDLWQRNLARESELLERRGRDQEELRTRMDESMERVASMQRDLNSLAGSLGQAQEAWRGQTDRLMQLAERTSEMLQTIDGDIVGGYERIEALVRQLNESIDFSQRRYQELIGQLRHEIETGLQGTFKSFDRETAQVVSHFSGTLVQLEDTVEALNQTLGKAQTMR